MRKSIAGLAVAALLLIGAIAVAANSGDDDPVSDPGSSAPSPTEVTPTAEPGPTSATTSPSSTTTTSGEHVGHTDPTDVDDGSTTTGHDHDGTATTDQPGTTHGHNDNSGAGGTSTTHDHGSTGTTTAGATTTTHHNGPSTTHDHGPTTTGVGPTTTTEPHHHGPGDDDWDDIALSGEEIRLLTPQVRFITTFFGTRYPTVADAEASGWRRAGRFSPGAGAHYVNIGLMHSGGPLDPGAAFGLIYDGIAPDSELVGVMYYSWAADPPDYFAGPNDRWHKHTGLCYQFNPDGSIDIPFPVDTDDITRSMCEARGGSFLEQTAWMLHVWAFEGWESDYGVFSHINPDLACADGTWDVDELGFCDGSEVT